MASGIKLSIMASGIALSGRRGTVPAAIVCDNPFGFGRPPRAGRVLDGRRELFEDRLHDAPSCLDAVIAREERPVPEQRIAEQALVRLHCAGGIVACDELDLPAHHRLPGRLDAPTGRDEHVRTEPETKIVRRTRLEVIEDS